MELREGSYNNLEDVKDDDMHTGYCDYKGKYVILDLDFFNKRKGDKYMKVFNRRAEENGFNIPNEHTNDTRYLLMTSGCTPYDGRANFDRCFFATLKDAANALGRLHEGVSLKEKIRIALKEDSVAKRNTRWSPDTQPNIYQLDIFLRKSGYRLVDVMDNEGHAEPIIESMKEGHLHPDITYSVSDQAFYVEVKKYGELLSSDLEEVIKGYQTALGVVKHLDSLDLNKLEFREESEEEE